MSNGHRRFGAVAALVTLVLGVPRAYAQAGAPAPTVAGPQSGHLVVKERAGRPIRVLVDGVDKGQAPWEGEVPPGTHEVSGAGPSLAAPAQPVDVSAGATVAIVLDAVTPTARLEVQTRDMLGQISLDGRVVGEGAFKGDVPSGPHVLAVTREGYDRHEESITLADKQVFAEKIVLTRSALTGLSMERPLEGLYGGFGLAMLAEPGGAGNEIDTRCSELGATRCSTQAPLGGALFGYVGYTWNPVGLEVFLAGEFDQSAPKATYNGQVQPGENPFVAAPARVEAFNFYRFGGAVALRVRATVQTRTLRASFAAGPGVAFKDLIVQRKTGATDGTNLQDSYVPGGVGYVSPALLGDASIHFRLSQATSVALGALLWIENAGSDARTASVPQYCFGSCALGPKTVPLSTPAYQAASSTQVFLGPYLGMQFGP